MHLVGYLYEEYQIYTNIKEASPTYFGTSVPSSVSIVCHVQNQFAKLLQSVVGSITDVSYI
jgi:hypothetical protein